MIFGISSLKEIGNSKDLITDIDSICVLEFFKVPDLLITVIIAFIITKWTTHLFVISKPWVYSQRFRNDSEVQ